MLLLAAVGLALFAVPALGASRHHRHHRRPHRPHHATSVLLPVADGRARALLVGTYHGITGQYATIQAAVDAARPGDWIMVGPGDHREPATHFAPGGKGDDRAPAAVLVQTPDLHIRGMDRNTVVLDNTRAGAPQCSSAAADQSLGPIDGAGQASGANGVVVYKVPGVSVENLTACNFLNGDLGGGDAIWFDGGGATGQQHLGSFLGDHLSATSTYYGGDSAPAGSYGIYVSNTYGPGLFQDDYASNMNDSAYYVGACPDCNTTLDRVHAQYSALGYSGTDSGGHLLVENSEFDHNKDGFDTNSQNNDDAPPPQDGECPPGQTGPQPPGTQRARSCWVFIHNYVHDNNNPNVPTAGVAGAGPTGTGMSLSGARHDIVTGNRFENNGAWGIVLVPYPDTEQPPDVSHCEGGTQLGTSAAPLCYFDDLGNEVAGNTFTHNGFFGNPSNGDVAELSNQNTDGNCWHGNVDTAGPLTSDPANIQSTHGTCGVPNYGDSLTSTFGVEVACDSGLLATCPNTVADNYPQRSQVQMPALTPQATMADPCAGAPRSAWCPVRTRTRAARRR